MPTESEAVVAQQEVAPTAPVTAPEAAPASDTSAQTVPVATSLETVDSSPKPITAFKKYSANELAQLQEDFEMKFFQTRTTGKAVVQPEMPNAESLEVEAPGVDIPNEEVTPVETKAGADETRASEEATIPDADSEAVEPEEPETFKEGGKPPQHRIRGENAVEDMALTIKRTASRNGKKMSFTEAETEAKRVLGIGDTLPEAPILKSVESAKSELDTLWNELAAAETAFDNEAKIKINRAIFEKNEEIRDIKQEISVRSQAEQNKITSTIQESRSKAATLYPDLLKDGKDGRPLSEMARVAGDIHRALVEAGDPAVNHPDYLLDLASRSAKATNTPPYLNGKTPTASKLVTRTVQPAKPVAPLGSPTARTTQPGQGQTVKELLGKMTPRQLSALTETLAARTGRL